MNQKPLPNKLSKLLRLAVNDAQLLESRPDLYKLNMSEWVRKEGPICEVCMAGAVMVCELTDQVRARVRAEKAAGPGGLVERDALYAINDMRAGNFFSAKALLLAGKLPEHQDDALQRAQDLVYGNYHLETGRAPWHIYLKAARILERAGL